MKSFNFGNSEDKTITDGVFTLEINMEDLDITYLLIKHEEEIVRIHLNMLNKYIDIDDCYSSRHDYNGECSLDCNKLMFLRDEYNAVKTYELIKEKITEIYIQSRGNEFVYSLIKEIKLPRVSYIGDNVYEIKGRRFEVFVGADCNKRVYIQLFGTYILLCGSTVDDIIKEIYRVLLDKAFIIFSDEVSVLLKLILENNRDKLNIGEFYTRQ